MPKPNRPPANTYQAHRDRQRRRILDAASKLFDERGIDRVTMAEITSASGVQASTTYQYFSNKDEIVWGLLGEVMAEDTERAKQKIEGGATGLAKITALLEFMADELSRNQARVRFMAQFDAMYARHWPAERLLMLEAKINPQGFKHFNKLIREGIRDGSLRSDLDPELTLHAVMNAVIGAQRRLASLGNKVEQEYGGPIEGLFRETVRIIVLGLSNTEMPQAPGNPKSHNKKHRKRNS